MIVMKFGGTSIATTEAVTRVVGIVQRHLAMQPVVVNSAMGKTTRNLLAIAHLSEAGKTDEARDKLREIIEYHTNLASSLLSDFKTAPVFEQLHTCFAELEKLLHGMAVLQDLTDRSLDKFLSYGERMSTAIITAVLNSNNVPAVLTDAREMIITNDRFGQARVYEEESYARIKQTLLPLVENKQVPVVQGYIGATRQGITTTLGFEGSDLTATLLGAGLQADDIQIWKDVPGIMTADPNLIENTRTIRQISFKEAGELTYFGAKVLHPSSLEPARLHNIAMHVCNSTQPDETGTEIVNNPEPGQYTVKSIAYMRDLCLLQIHSNRTRHACDFMKSVYDVLNRLRLTPLLTASAETRISLILKSGNFDRLAEELKPYAGLSVQESRGSITLVGENLKSTASFPQKVLSVLGKIPIDLIGHGPSDINMTLILDEKAIASAVKTLHCAFFQNDQDV